MNSRQLNEIVQAAVRLNLAKDDRRDLLLYFIEEEVIASLPRHRSPADQLRSDIFELWKTRWLHVWLRNAVDISADLEQVDVLRRFLVQFSPPVEASPEADGPQNLSQHDAVSEIDERDEPRRPAPPPRPTDPRAVDLLKRLRALMQACLDRHPELRAELADRVVGESVLDAIMDMTAEALSEVLVHITWESELLRGAVQELAMLALPTAIDWRELKAARQRGGAHVQLPFMSGPLCEIALAGLGGRPAQLKSEHDCPAAVRDPTGGLIPLRRERGRPSTTIAVAIAQSILLKAGMKNHELPRDDATLIERARQQIDHRRAKARPRDRYQMYLVFDEADPDAIESMVGALPELWLVQGKPDRPVHLYEYLRDLYGWPKDT